jgi:hypothetical protein
MVMKRCERDLHFYDPDKHISCPYCKNQEEIQYDDYDNEIVDYLCASEVTEKGSGLYHFALSPDGLPFLVKINPPPKAEDLLIKVTSFMGVESSPPIYEKSPLEPIVNDLNEILKRYFIQNISNERGEIVKATIVPKPIKSLIPSGTLTTLIFKEFIKPNFHPAESRVEADTRSIADQSEDTVGIIAKPQIKFKVNDSCLALPIDGQQIIVVKKVIRENGWPEYTFERNFEEESIDFFQEGNLIGFVEDMTGYYEEKLEIKERDRYKEFRNTNPDINWKLEISLNLIGKIILEISKSLYNLHSTNIIHGDVKPGNVLITKNSVTIIDSLKLSDGTRSPAMSKGWAAPEQIIGDKICFSTDQYPIGITVFS